MDVLFFYIDTYASSGYTTGLGIASISGYLKRHGVTTDLVYYKTDLDFTYAMEKIRMTAPAIIGFYSTSSQWQKVRELSETIRKRYPNIFQIYGGIHATLVPETLDMIKSLDVLCVGYGERPMLELVQRLEAQESILNVPGLWIRQRNGDTETIIKNPANFPTDNHDELLAFDHHLFLKELSRFPDFDVKTYRLEIIFSRGCPFKCSFCCNHRLNEIYENCHFRPSPEASIEALKQAIQETNLNLVEIHDDILTLNKKWFRTFITRYAQDIKTSFICNLRVGTFDEEDLYLLKQANIRMAWVGIESGDEYIRNEVMNKRISRKQIVEAFHFLHKHDIPVITQNIIGVPYETPRRFIETIRLNAEISPTEHQLSVFCPYPTTELFEISRKAGWIKVAGPGLIERVDPVIETPDFPQDKIAFYFRNFGRLVKYQQLRNHHPSVYFLPLTPRLSVMIASMMAVREYLGKMTRAGFWSRIRHILRALYSWGMKLRQGDWVRFGNLRRLTPIDKDFGLHRGQPIDRYYIEQFLSTYVSDIQGRVLEIADNIYTHKFGGGKVTQSDVLHASEGNPEATIVADLTCADHLPSNVFDCIICTQTLQCLYDLRAAIQTLHRILKPGGVLLATFSGISQISRYDMDRWGEYWRFTDLSVKRLIQEVFPEKNVTVEMYGNVFVAMAFLYGLAADELKPQELDYKDPNYQVLLSMRAVK